MKTIAIILIGLVVLSFVMYSYNTDGIVKVSYNKYIKNQCELKQLDNGYTQIENCAVYKMGRRL